jgi:hypothetical protein
MVMNLLLSRTRRGRSFSFDFVNYSVFCGGAKELRAEVSRNFQAVTTKSSSGMGKLIKKSNFSIYTSKAT